MLYQLRHPNIVSFRGAVWCTYMVAVVMELVTNGDVGDALRNPALSMTWEDPKLRMMNDAATGMEYLHSRSYLRDAIPSNRTTDALSQSRGEIVTCIIHRDLKPANMLLTNTFSLKLTDFGEARSKDTNHTMTSVGTPLYQAPEITRGERYDEKVC